jgi:hypothetical protein
LADDEIWSWWSVRSASGHSGAGFLHCYQFFVKITNKINGAGLKIEIIGLKLVPDVECLRLPFVVEGMK